MFGSLLRGFALGWVVGHALGTLVVRRAKRRGWDIDRDDVTEKWALAFAIVLAALNALFRMA